VRAARDEGVLLEIDSQPERLDLPDVLVRVARDAGVRLVVSSGALRAAELSFLRYGIDQARRGWCEARDVANTLEVEAFCGGLRRNRARARAGRGAVDGAAAS